MLLLVVGLLLFLGVHSVGILGLRDRAVAALGEGPWKGSYSLVSAVGLGLMVYGYGLARAAPTFVWAPPLWTRHLALLLMVPVFPLLSAAYLPGRISRALRHPMLIGTGLWAAAHLLANGMLHDVVLFGGWLLWAAADLVSFSRRTQRPIARAPEGRLNDLLAVGVGLLLYGLTVGVLHAWVIGVSPLP